MKKIFLLLPVFILLFNISAVNAQTLTDHSTVVNSKAEDINSIITNKSSEADINNLQAELQTKGVKLTILSIDRKSDGIIKSISIRVSSADGVVNYNAPDFTELVIERNAKVKIGVSGGDTKQK